MSAPCRHTPDPLEISICPMSGGHGEGLEQGREADRNGLYLKPFPRSLFPQSRPRSGHSALTRSANRRPERMQQATCCGYSITSSARASSVGGMVRPRAFAVLRLTTSSYLVGACTGMSAGFSPLRIRSTYPAARRSGSCVLGP